MMDGYRTAARAAMFLALVGVELWLARSTSEEASIRGFIETREYSVSSAQKGVLTKLDVALGQSVTAGQVVAELDASTFESEIAVRAAERKSLLAQATHAQPRAKARASDANTAAAPVDDRLGLVNLELADLNEKRSALRLKAPADGVVESIDAHVGDAVSSSSPVATVVAADTRRVVACVPESRIAEVAVGSSADVRALSGGDRHYAGTVESMTLAVALFPARCQPFSKVPTYGRIAVVVLDAPAQLAPGQATLVSFGATAAPTSTNASASATAKAPLATPALIDVPPELASATRFEPSGLVWVKGLDRYVVVSDDTGLGEAHPPWLFTMTRHGALDPEPLVVEDLKQLDDVESIAAGDDGALWLLSSQSVSEKGGRPKAREALVRIVPAGTGYRMDAKVHLAALLEAAPDAVRAGLALPDASALDIEGMAYRAGALYFGLKAPVDDKGRAVLWKVGAPERLLAGDLAGAQLSVWARVSLSVEIEGKAVPGGIADMMFLDDARLLVTATASGLSGKHQTGALYEVSEVGAAGDARAAQLRTFADLKPEGIAASATPGRAAMVFDRGKAAPLWLEIDVPRGAP